MRLSILASGSSGNALVAQAGDTRVLIDCGLSLRRLGRRMGAVGLEVAALDAVVISHEHTDHTRGLEVFLRHHQIPVLATAGTAGVLRKEVPLLEPLVSGREVTIGELAVLPVSTSHDAREPVGFVLTHGDCRVGVITDTGVGTQLLIERISGCHALLLECNHDLDMLRAGPYPWPLKQRIASRTGHLSNEQARAVLEAIVHGELELVVGMHLSRENNRPELVERELQQLLAGSPVQLMMADQFEPLVVSVGTAGAGNQEGGPGRRGMFDSAGEDRHALAPAGALPRPPGCRQ
ncbi:MAG: MBL fold metallo-hydrolase [Acidobacteriota bacterium]